MKRENDDFAGRSSNSGVVELYQSQMDEIAQEKTSLPSDLVYFSLGSDLTTANIMITFTINFNSLFTCLIWTISIWAADLDRMPLQTQETNHSMQWSEIIPI